MNIPTRTTIKPRREIQPESLKNGDLFYYKNIGIRGKCCLYATIDSGNKGVEAYTVFREKSKYKLGIYIINLWKTCLDGDLCGKFYKAKHKPIQVSEDTREINEV